MLGERFKVHKELADGSQAFKDVFKKELMKYELGLAKPHKIEKNEWMVRINGYHTQGQICMKCIKLIAETHGTQSTEDAALEGLGALFG